MLRSLHKADAIGDSKRVIRICPIGERRVFEPTEVSNLVRILTRLSRRASQCAIRRAAQYGRLRESEPEWSVLKHEMRQIIRAWAEHVGRLGAEPMELWTVCFKTHRGCEYWRYEPEIDASINLDRHSHSLPSVG